MFGDLAKCGPMVGMRSDEKARVGEANDPLPSRPSLSFTVGGQEASAPARHLG